jgi:hypothetical protein
MTLTAQETATQPLSQESQEPLFGLPGEAATEEAWGAPPLLTDLETAHPADLAAMVTEIGKAYCSKDTEPADYSRMWRPTHLALLQCVNQAEMSEGCTMTEYEPRILKVAQNVALSRKTTEIAHDLVEQGERFGICDAIDETVASPETQPSAEDDSALLHQTMHDLDPRDQEAYGAAAKMIRAMGPLRMARALAATRVDDAKMHYLVARREQASPVRALFEDGLCGQFDKQSVRRMVWRHVERSGMPIGEQLEELQANMQLGRNIASRELSGLMQAIFIDGGVVSQLAGQVAFTDKNARVEWVQNTAKLRTAFHNAAYAFLYVPDAQLL